MFVLIIGGGRIEGRKIFPTQLLFEETFLQWIHRTSSTLSITTSSLSFTRTLVLKRFRFFLDYGGCIGLYEDNGEEHGNYYNGLYTV